MRQHPLARLRRVEAKCGYSRGWRNCARTTARSVVLERPFGGPSCVVPGAPPPPPSPRRSSPSAGRSPRRAARRCSASCRSSASRSSRQAAGRARQVRRPVALGRRTDGPPRRLRPAAGRGALGAAGGGAGGGVPAALSRAAPTSAPPSSTNCDGFCGRAVPSAAGGAGAAASRPPPRRDALLGSTGGDDAEAKVARLRPWSALPIHVPGSCPLDHPGPRPCHRHRAQDFMCRNCSCGCGCHDLPSADRSAAIRSSTPERAPALPRSCTGARRPALPAGVGRPDAEEDHVLPPRRSSIRSLSFLRISRSPFATCLR